jgi:hypothetical protein
MNRSEDRSEDQAADDRNPNPEEECPEHPATLAGIGADFSRPSTSMRPGAIFECTAGPVDSVGSVNDQRPPEIQPDETVAAGKYVEYLKHLGSFVEAERELQDKDPRELRAMVLVFLSTFKQQQFTAKDRANPGSDPEGWNRYSRWSRVENLDEAD